MDLEGVVGEAGDYTLTFEYTGDNDPAPNLTIPENFYSGISDELGETKGEITAVNFPAETASIGGSAFKGVDSIKAVNLEDTKISTIGTSAFQNCTALEGVKFPKTLTEIGVSAFEGDKALKSADFSLLKENSVSYSSVNAPNPALRLRNRAFYGSGLTSVDLPDQLNWVGIEVFMNCADLKDVSMPAFSYYPMGTNDRGSYMFAGCSSLEELKYREVSGRTHYSNSYSNYFPDYALKGCSSLKVLDLSGFKGERYSNFQIRNIFLDSDLSALEELILPENPTYSIFLYKNTLGTFQNKTGLSDLSVIKNPESIGRVDADTFNGSGITEADMSEWTNTGFTTINATTFANCDDLTKAVIPTNITTINDRAFANDPKLKTVEIHSRNLTSVNSSLFNGSDSIETVIIGKEADKLTGNLFAGVSKETHVLFEGENLISINKATASGGTNPLKNLEGSYYADENGVLYKLDDDGTATVAYIPPGITSYTVPSAITTPDNKEYTVDRVAPYFCNLAEDLTALTFEDPSQVTVPTNAFAGWTTADDAKGKTINGAIVIRPPEWKAVSLMCSYPLDETVQNARLVPSIEYTVVDADGKESIKTIIVVSYKEVSADDTYDYKTGEAATYTIAVSNPDNTIMDKVVRVYFAYDASGYSMGSFPVGNFSLVNPGDDTYPLSVVETDTPGIYYYDITGVNPGQTLAFQNDVFYESPNTPGGGLRIWTETLTPEQAEAKKGQFSNPKDYLQLDWSTTPVTYNLTKSNTTVYNTSDSTTKKGILKSTSDGDILITNLAFRIKESNPGSSSTTQGADYIKWVQYEDTLELPDGAWWDPEIIKAIRKGRKGASGDTSDGWYIYDGTTYIDSNSSQDCRTLRVTANGNTYDIAYVYSPTRARSYILDLAPTIIKGEDGKDLIKLSWRVNNDYFEAGSEFPNAEYTVSEYYLRYGDNVLYADIDTVNEIMSTTDENGKQNLLTLHNKADESRHYSFSDIQKASSEVDAPVKGDAGLVSSKAYEKNNGTYSYYNGGAEDYMYVTLTNTGIMDLDTWGQSSKDAEGNTVYNGKVLADNLPIYFYIQPKDIESMFNAEAKAGTGASAKDWSVGDWLAMTITNASLFTEGAYQPSEGVGQNGKYDINSTVSAANDKSARVYERARMVLRKNADGVIEVTLSGDSKTENNRTYSIGEGQDYDSLEAFFRAIGFMPTYNTQYQLSWNTDDFVLRAGQSMRIRVLGSYKTTPMLLTNDVRNSRGYYSSSSYLRNYANVYGKVGETAYSKQITPSVYHYWQSELFIGKAGYIQGSSSSVTGSSIVLKDGTVVDANVYGYNQNGKAYETMSMHDAMNGAQVLLVPVARNPELKAPDGTELETYNATGGSYWLLNKAGTYKNVIVGSTSRDGTQIYEAETIVVTKKAASLDTEIHWKEFENWGATSGRTNIWYKTLVSADKAGLHNSGGEDSGSYQINNKAWLGDHQGHRLYDLMGKVFQVYSLSKHIVSDNGKKDGTDSTSAGTLQSYSRLSHGKTVTYQFQINNTSSSPTTLKGNRIYDYLPNTYGVFDWTRGDENTAANVTNLRYYASDGVVITKGSGENKVELDGNGGSNEGNDDYWKVVQRKNSNGTPTVGRYDIKWDSDFTIQFPTSGSVKILVDVTYPERTEGTSLWDQYLAADKGALLYNYFYLDSRYSYVTHSMEAEGKPVLYKGVYDTGLTTRYPGSTSSNSSQYYSNKSRLMYANGPDANSYNDTDLKTQTATYYTVVYNGSYDRLYLSDIQDQLPRGFTFNSFANRYDNTTTTRSTSSYRYVGFSGNKTYYGATSGYTNQYSTEYPGTSYGLVTLDNSKDQYDNNTISYVNATVRATTANGSDGRQHITFSVVGGASYDSAVGKYYLNPGQALRINYNVEIGSFAKTDKLATNTAAMPYYDYYELGFRLHVPDEDGNGGVTQKTRALSGVNKDNYGGCETMTADEVAEKYSFSTAGYEGEKYNTGEDGNWLVSDVTLERADIVPGINKTVGGITPKPASVTPTTILGSKGSDSQLSGGTYSGGCKTTDIVNWSVRVFNEGGTGNENVRSTLEDYTITDTVASPYGFTGQVFYNLYRGSGSKVSSASQYLFTIGPRSENDTAVTIGSGSSVGSKKLRIGSAENGDGEWYSFGTGANEGKVKIERNASGQEIITINLVGSKYGIPAGCWSNFFFHTQYTEESAIVISEGKYNDVVVMPNKQGYEAADVAQGRARTKQVIDDDGNVSIENDGVQSGTSVMLTQGYNTESWKEVTENTTGETASSDSSNNFIKLSEKTNSFRYDLFMIAPQAIMSKLVMIDDLPQEGDHSAFVEEDKRYSDFTVGFLEDNLDFKVKIAPSKGGNEKQLTADQYKLYVSPKTEFEDADWNGEGADWTEITNLSGSELAAILKESRSFRVVIEDPNAWGSDQSKLLMSNKSQIHLSFNAKVDDDTAKPGEYAWNSFGYKYDVVPNPRINSKISLEAQPLSAGVRFPAAPVLSKKLTEDVIETVEHVDEESGEVTKEDVTKTVPKAAERDMTARFIIYEGDPIEALNDAAEMSSADIAAALRAAGRKYIYAPLEIKKSQTSAELGLWTVDYCSKYDAGSDTFFDDTENPWRWGNAQKYSVIELGMARFNYGLQTFTIGKNEFDSNNRGFTNSNETKLAITAANMLQITDLEITKNMDGYYDGGLDSNVTMAFEIVGTDIDDPEEEIFRNYVGMSFGPGDDLTRTVTVKDVPINAVISVKELYAGNYTADEEEKNAEYVKKDNLWIVSFDNTHRDQPHSGSGIVNKYKDGTYSDREGIKEADTADSPK